VTAVYCYNDRMAMGLYDGLREQGLSIPDDMAVVGFDNQEVIAAHLRPPLSTVSLPHYELGAAGVRMLLGSSTSSSSVMKTPLGSTRDYPPMKQHGGCWGWAQT
jgi:LacI family transcriptional regulator